MTNHRINAGDIWICTKTGYTFEWLKDVKVGDPLVVSTMLINGKPPKAGDKIPEQLLYKGMACIVPQGNIRVIRNQVDANT